MQVGGDIAYTSKFEHKLVGGLVGEFVLVVVAIETPVHTNLNPDLSDLQPALRRENPGILPS
jgi:hypothetical protein